MGVPTGIKDMQGFEIYTEKHLLFNRSKKKYIAYTDRDLGIAIKDVYTGTIEQLTQEVASQLQIGGIIWQPTPYE